MENRDRDRVSQRTSSTDAGDINRKTSEEKGRQQSGTGAEFGQKIGRSENLSEEQGGMMRNKDRDNLGSNMENESSRRSGSDSFSSQSGRSGSSSGSSIGSNSGSTSNVDRSSGSDITRDDSESTSRSSNSNRSGSDWNQGRH